MPQPVVFRPRGGLILAVIAIALSAVVLVFAGITGGAEGLVLWGWPIVAFAWLAWLVYIHPCVVITDGFVEIRNILRTHRVPWGDVDEVGSQYALTVRTRAGRSIRAWAAPAPSARRAMSTRREEVAHSPGDGDMRRPSDAEGTESGDAATIVGRHLESYRRAGGPALPGSATTTWNVPLTVLTAVLLVAAAASLVGAAAHG
ncbi:PH domain-containing protein [Microbacterium fluvii]|uniref:PH domain-containing protein n=1 Tax=Microbacterium fluvii TaxID=415215 RepID=A0ABW2HBD7_9MICO|nr:PH domain-containing protein [Microbacterium fluvii]MCU4672270.1 PH domain-containing protein [Microbacterium fluvii]